MINLDYIKKLAVKYQTTELNIRREYFQHLFLSYFYQEVGSENFCFKGGTALRIIYGSPRFSEDLDFSSKLGNLKEIENVLVGTLSNIEKEGIKVKIVDVVWTSGGYLANLEFNSLAGDVPLMLQISCREKILLGTKANIKNDFIQPYLITQLQESQLTNGKVEALLDRHKPRDFYDLYFMLRANLLDKKQKDQLPKALEVLKKANIDFESELKDFLPRSHWLIIKDLKKGLESEIKRFIV